MPKWGLTTAMRATQPWGLEESWLRPGKVITDPVHGDLYFTKLEIAIIDSPAFQRLRRVRQLGNTHLVYPGATHTRFSHSLGAVKVAQDLVDVVIDQRSGRDPSDDLFVQWERQASGSDEPGGQLSVDARRSLDKRCAEVTVLARLGALLHDLCHVPFGHSIEDDLGILKAHDKNLERFGELWKKLPADVRNAIASADRLEGELIPLILSKRKRETTSEYPFVADIVGNTICADLLDYLRRDHLYTGLPLALGRRFEAGFYVLPNGDPLYEGRLVLRIYRGGDERVDAVTEILKHLRYRYELSERALVHHAKLAADSMIGKALEMWRDALWAETASDRIYGTEADVPGQVDEDLKALADQLGGGGKPKKIAKTVRGEIERVMTKSGDDGLLEYLRDLPRAPRRDTHHRDERRRKAVSALAQAVLDRDLYKRIARQRHTRLDRTEFYEKFGRPETRRELEQTAARFAEVKPAWHVLIWLPSPDMRLKVADVLVDDGKEIRAFATREAEDGGRRRGLDIYEAHKNLWEVSIYVHRSVKENVTARRRVLASLAADLDLHLGELEKDLGPRPWEWPHRLVLKAIEDEQGVSFGPERTEELIEEHSQTPYRGSGGRPSFSALTEEYRQLLK